MTKSQEHISKFISLILRHKSEAIGITLDTNGWADVVELMKGMQQQGKSVELLDLQIVVDMEQRLAVVTASLAHLADQIEIVTFEGIISNYASENNADVMIRGIRDGVDLSYEFNLEQFTRKTSKMETLYLTPKIEHINTSSGLVRMFLTTDNNVEAKVYMSKDGFYTMSKMLKSEDRW